MEIYQPLWRGTNIISKRDSTGKYINMAGSKSLLYIPVEVKENTKYKIKILVKKKNGNGIMFCNLYGNENYDFTHIKIVCENFDWEEKCFVIETKEFPKTIPLFLRFWRSPLGAGEVFLKKIEIELYNETSEIEEIPKNTETISKKTEITPNVKKIIIINEENFKNLLNKYNELKNEDFYAYYINERNDLLNLISNNLEWIHINENINTDIVMKIREKSKALITFGEIMLKVVIENKNNVFIKV